MLRSNLATTPFRHRRSQLDSRLHLLVALLGCGATGAHGHAPTQVPAPNPSVAGETAADSTTALVPVHDSFTVASQLLGELRRINVYLPPTYRASAPRRVPALPVLYMPDGGLDEDFPHVANTVDSLIARRAIGPTIVVGIPNTQRRRDLTGPTRFASDSAIAPQVGGSAIFRRFLREELIPEVERRYRTTPERAIIGESLAGLFVVETFYHDANLFTHYVALDPSLWWNGGELVRSIEESVVAPDSRPRTLYLATSDVAEIAAGTARLAALLKARPRNEIRWHYEPRPDLTHGTIFRALKAKALVNALR